MEFVIQSQGSKELSICIVFRKTNKSFKKMHNNLFWDPFGPNLGKYKLFTKIMHCHFLASYGSLTSCKKSEKANEPILRITLNGRMNEQTN